MDFPVVDGDDCDQRDDCDRGLGLDSPLGFVARLSDDLTELEHGDYLGGSGFDQPRVIAADRGPKVYVAGDTDSFDFPISNNAHDQTFNGGTSDGFIAHIVHAGAAIFNTDFEQGDMEAWIGD